MNGKRKGTRAEHRVMKLLEKTGYVCTRAAGSLGLFDVIAIGSSTIRLIQVKSGGEYLSGIEREAICALVVPPNVTRECWRLPTGCRSPLIEIL